MTASLHFPTQPISQHALPAIPEDTTCNKFAAALPFLGVIPFLICDRGIGEQIEQVELPNRLIQLIKLKNEFKVCAIISALLNLATVVALAATGIVASSAPSLIGASLIVLGVTLLHIGRIFHNREVIAQIEKNPASAVGLVIR